MTQRNGDFNRNSEWGDVMRYKTALRLCCLTLLALRAVEETTQAAANQMTIAPAPNIRQNHQQ